MRDGTAERVQGKIIFSCFDGHVRDWQLTRLIYTTPAIMCDHNKYLVRAYICIFISLDIKHCYGCHSLRAASVDESIIAPTTLFPIWTRFSRREVRATRRLYAGGGSCSGDLWRACRILDCRST